MKKLSALSSQITPFSSVIKRIFSFVFVAIDIKPERAYSRILVEGCKS